jgi:hypothetical protein
MRPQFKFLVCLFAFCFASVTFGAEVYVAPTGKDSNDGSASAPLATLAAARDKVKGNAPATVYLHAGTYYLTTPLVFGPENSGTATAPIIFKAYPGEKPVISGGIKVTSSWTISSGSIMKTTIAKNLKVDQLFLNGKRQVLARYPNFSATTVILDGYAADCISATRVARWANPTEGPGYIRALQSRSWGSWSEIITAKNGTTVTSSWVGDHGRTDFPGMHTTYRMVENIFEELDAAGEWFYRRSTGELFFWPPSGTDLSSATIELASLDELVRFVGTSMTSVTKHIQFNGITFTHTYRTLFSKPYEPVTMSDWAIARTGTVFMQNAENIRVDNCFFDQVGGNGIFISGYNKSHVIYNNVFTDAGASCVAIMGPLSSIRCGRTRQGSSSVPCNNDKTPGPLTNEYPSLITVDNNMMDHFGRFEKQPAGVALSATECDTIRHNTIHDCPRAGINFCDGCWGGHLVEYNWVYNSVLETGDHGPFNAWGRDRNEMFGNGPLYGKLDAWKTSIIRNNRFEVRVGYFGIDLDDGSTNYLQYNNLLMGGGLKLQFHRFNRYLNNIIVKGGNVHFDGLKYESGDSVAHNIIFGTNNPYPLCCFTGGGYLPDTIRKHLALFDSNVIKIPSGNPPAPTGYTWAQWTAAGLDVHSSLADPMFIDTNKTWPNYAPKGDYSVKSGSPALALGFKNFPMDSFGVMKSPVGTFNQLLPNNSFGPENAGFKVRYYAGQLHILHDGDYRVTITTALGRTIKAFHGKGNASFSMTRKNFGTGIYLVVIQAKDGIAKQKLIVE